jgi:predicted patatin/cPLA2 family phospholipase
MTDSGYTHTPIKGKQPQRTLPQGNALVLEGGGTRGFFGAGVFDAFIDAGIMFPYVAAVSAGTANAYSYISGQKGRTRQIIEHYVADKRYVGMRNLLLHRSFFNLKFAFLEIAEKHIEFDWEIFDEQDIRFLTGAIDCSTGKTAWFEKQDITRRLETLIASCSIPLLSPIVKFKGFKLLDGGVSDPIPIERSVADGNSFHVAVLTRNAGFESIAYTRKKLLSVYYRKYPAVVQTILGRHNVYSRQLALCEQLEKEGRAVIIRPVRPLELEGTESDTKRLIELYDEGYEEAAGKIEMILSRAETLLNI